MKSVGIKHLKNHRSEYVKLAEAVREGWVTPPLVTGGILPRCRPVAPLRRILRELSDDREDR